MEKISYLQNGQWILEKGSMRRIAPINNNFSDINAHNWVDPGGNLPEYREKTIRLEGSKRIRAINKLLSEATSRINSATGEREFLLYRGMQNHELNSFKTDKIDSHTSWTSDAEVAAKFADQQSDSTDSSRVSAWIPEKHIHSVPRFVGAYRGQEDLKNEKEVIVAPHNDLKIYRVWSYPQRE